MSRTGPLTWVLETDVFASGHAAMEKAAHDAGHAVVHWNDDWWWSSGWPKLGDATVVFHGSLGNADRVRRELPWSPGAFCDTEAFRCSAWYDRASNWLLHQSWVHSTVEQLAAAPTDVLQTLGGASHVFVRPDSPLKPFSGRVLAVDAITPEALDHGYYYDDATIPVVAAPVRTVGREWRYVVVDGVVIAGSAYEAASRSAVPDDPGGEPWAFAQSIASELRPPEAVYVLDVCEADGRLHLLELNPFSGADLYACDRAAVVRAVATLLG